jgi:type IV pilus assembly protein PilC
MQKYTYKALATNGKVVQGRIDATDDEDFNKVLAEKGLKPFWFTSSGRRDKSAVKKLDTIMILTFCRQLSSMLTAGLPLSKSLEMLYERTEKPKLKAVLAFLFEGVQKGNSLAESMMEMGDNVFPPLLTSMVKSGEMSGQLESTLLKMADHFEKQRKQEQKIKSAMSYPKMLGFVLVVVVVAMIKLILPNMTSTMEPDDIPGPTAFLLSIDDFITNNYILLIVGVVFMIVGFPMLKRIDSVKLFFDKTKLAMPMFGKLNKQVYTSRFASSLATLCSSGVPLLDAMNMCSELIGNKLISQQLDSAIEGIRRGESISASLQAIDSFDPLLTTMIFVGEESGSLETILMQTATYFEGESNDAIGRLTGMITPIMTMVMGVVVGFVLIAIMMPMFSAYDDV